MSTQTDVDKATLSWLTSVPVTDLNFKHSLERANRATVEAALDEVRTKAGVKTKVKALEVRLRAIQKAEAQV